MKKVFLFLASCMLVATTGAKTVTVSNSDLSWERNDNGEMEARIVIGSIGCQNVELYFTDGNQSKVPCYRVAIIDNGDPDYDYWHELSDWENILEVNSSGSGSTTISLHDCGVSSQVIAFFIQLDKNPNAPTQYSVSLFQNDSPSMGTLTGEGTYNEGERVLISAEPYSDYMFKEWSDGSTENPRYITVTSNIRLWAVFERKPRYDFMVDGIAYNIINGSEVEVTSKSPYMYSGDISIPSSVQYGGKSYVVTTIGDSAFYSCFDLTSIVLPNSVTTIEDRAFVGCKFTSFTIPNSVTSIGEYALNFYYNLVSLNIPSDLDISNSGLFYEGDGFVYELKNGKSVEFCAMLNDEIKEFEIPTIISAYGNTFTVSSIGYQAFGHLDKITSIIIPSSVTVIEGGAFCGDVNLTAITCMAKTPPSLSVAYVDEDDGEIYPTFYNYGSYITVYVPAESVSAYKSAPVWKTLNIQPIPSENITLPKDEVYVNVEKSTADFSMPVNESANSYTLTIRNNGITFCTLTFNSNGQLTDIDFTTTKGYELKADVSAFKFTVTGLSEATDYKYSFKVLSASKAVLKEYVGSFTTKNEDGTGGSVQGGGEGTLAVDAVSNATAVTIVNGQILVNGEAPAFVVTVAGQKIANANLKAGVYFVVADGETVGVSVR